MTEVSLTLPIVLLLSATAAALVWVVRVLWQLDRRIVKIEARLGLKGETLP